MVMAVVVIGNTLSINTTQEDRKMKFTRKINCLIVVAMFILVPICFAAKKNEPKPIAFGDVQLKRIHHDENLLPDVGHAGFGSLLIDSNGKVAMHDGNKTWLYTTGLFESPTGEQRDWYGKWVSHVREFDTKTLVSTEKHVALGLYGDETWAVIHHAMKISDDLYVVFYSTSAGVKAAVNDRPDGLFETDPDFKLSVTEAWEDEGGEKDSLESTGGHVKIEESDDHITFWLLYDSYHVDQTRGELGWAKVRVDKKTRKVELVEKHQDNPLPLRPENYIAARAGGNAGDVMLGGKHAFFYYTRPNRNIIMLSAALSSDPLFFKDVTDRVEIDTVLGTEKVIEKFEAYILENILYIIYENKLATGHWGTGIRLYEIMEKE
jgi:hypothetical protein